MSNLYEANISMTYTTHSPEEAAKLFLDNLRMHTDWFVEVKCVDTGEKFTVDSADWEVEENAI